MIEIRKDDDSSYRFLLKNTEGQTLFSSIEFGSKKEIAKTVNKLTKTRQPAVRFERKTDYNGKFLFNLRDKKGKVLGKSGLYSSEAGMENGIKNVISRISDLPSR